MHKRILPNDSHKDLGDIQLVQHDLQMHTQKENDTRMSFSSVFAKLQNKI
jgi:hypothetical protein